MRWHIILALTVLTVIGLIFSHESPKDLAQERIAYANKGVGDIIIGVTWPFSLLDDHFKEGLLLAQEEINKSGGVLGRKLVLDIRENHGELKKARKIARSFIKNEKMAAVIGHAYSSIAVETSVVYEEAGLLLLTPRAQLSTLSQHGLQLFFRSSPANRSLGEKAAFFTSYRNYRHPIIVMESSDYSRDLANTYETALALQGIAVVYTYNYLPWSYDYRSILNDMSHMTYDMIFIAMDGKEATDFIFKARTLGITSPIMCLNMPSTDMIKYSGNEADTLFNVVFYQAGEKALLAQKFEQAFQRRFSFKPDNWAAKGYDSVKLLAYVIEKTKTTDPFQVAANLRYLKNWDGVAGNYSFSINGDVEISPFYLEETINGKVSYTSEYDFPAATLSDMFNRIFEMPIAWNMIEITEKDGVVGVVLSEKWLFGSDISSIDYGGRLSLDGIAYIFNELDSSSTLHILSHLQYSTVNLSEGIGDLLSSDIEDLRSMTVGSYLVGQGVNSKDLFIEGSDQSDILPDSHNPNPVRVTGNWMAIMFIPDSLFTSQHH